ncbi:MAG: helix-turn-helix domain-containing protein, partial [Planctomycetes bacterium]|nr:helix-turn-helix domain-containing protein [Planctomycetota bacterium]
CESIRFKRACDMLQQGQAQLQQIADACGFSDASSFSRSFKRFAGKSPREWKV